MENSSLFFSVRRCEPELIRPAKPTPCGLELLSEIDDQEGLRFHMSFILFYKNNINGSELGKDPVKVVREALSKALVYYYPFAGRVREGDNRKLMVDCQGQGVLFMEADADITLEEIGDSVYLLPCPYIEELLWNVPHSNGILASPLLLIQVTRFKCGGFSFAIRMNHTISDSLGLVQFLITIGEVANGATQPSQMPTWNRDIFNARKPPRISFTHNEYSQNIFSMEAKHHSKAMIHKAFFFSHRQLLSIRNSLPSNLQNTCTTFEILTAFLWKCRTISLGFDPLDKVGVSYMVNARGRKDIQVPNGYYGNAFAFPMVLSKVGLVCDRPLGYALELVKKIKTQMTLEYIKSVADLMVIKGRPCFNTQVGSFIVADTTRVPFGKVDFGWGKPVSAGITSPVPSISFFARSKNRGGEEGIVVPIWLPPLVMERFERELKKMLDTTIYGGIISSL
ncbi:methanol O-anthraniloyltransferase-like [Ziziphus jujuba]|uniref:Methanol O-anthraniloyltransferase-like n=1 Tax=Ziziphus jujuba TaxID=326968 RepID=A0ABM3I4U8_ZIZJJ|nr:methanol O-anthraniloyltransferase-like [Ziziphus jujuba]